MSRITQHPILAVEGHATVPFFFEGRKLLARKGEVISSALFANGVSVFGHHASDGSPQGIFCANGQCAQCLVIVDGVPVKGCMVQVREGMRISACDGIPELPEADREPAGFGMTRTLDADVLIVGGGPSGITAALELAPIGVDVVILDDKHRLGGKMVLQTHSFFGTVADCYAGTRGTDIAVNLEREVAKHANIRVMLNATAVACYHDGLVGVVTEDEYLLIRPKRLLVAAGAREKALAFPGCDLPGVYGAGAFQTLVNRDLVKPSERLFIIGGGNVGLIAAYHAIQAGIGVVGLVEAMPEVGGYKVHQDKVKRLGVPVLTSHTVKCATGKDRVELVTVVTVDQRFREVPGTERTFAADTLLVAVGLNPVAELYDQAKAFGIETYSAGDAFEIAEASAAIFSGRIAGRRIAQSLGRAVDIPAEWQRRWEILKSKPGKTHAQCHGPAGTGVFPVIRCVQEIPCDPCVHACPKGMIEMKGDPVFGIPEVVKDECTGCTMCVAACPGLAISLVDLRDSGPDGLVTVPFELLESQIPPGGTVDAVDIDGTVVAPAQIEKVARRRVYDRTLLVTLRVPRDKAAVVAGFRVQDRCISEPVATPVGVAPPAGGARTPGSAAAASCAPDDTIICRCERVKAGDIRRLIRTMVREGVSDLNQLKVLRCGMGACGGKTCQSLVQQVCREEGIDPAEVVPFTQRPLVAEVNLALLAGETEDG
jgi:sarcosine oxidase subunit alpha